VEALEEAIMKYGTPDILNTDQGSQFTSDSFTGILKTHGIKISMDGNGRWRDNIFIERLWKTVRYEEIYLKAYESISHAKKELMKFFGRYNTRRTHQGLDDRTPDNVYWRTLPNVKDAV
jgi:putative transposase